MVSGLVLFSLRPHSWFPRDATSLEIRDGGRRGGGERGEGSEGVKEEEEEAEGEKEDKRRSAFHQLLTLTQTIMAA